MMARTLTRYFGWRFFTAVLTVFFGLLLLVAMVDFIEMLRRTSDMRVPTAYVAAISLYRVPFLTERILPFTVLVGAMVSYLSPSRRLELVVAASAGLSAWQFVTPAVVIAILIGAAATMVYNPLSAELRERSSRLEGDLFRRGRSLYELDTGFWIRQRNDDGQAIINAKTSRDQGLELGTVTVFRLDASDHVIDRIHAKKAVLRTRFGFEEARVLFRRRSAEKLQQLGAAHLVDRHAGARKLCHSGNGAVLEARRLHPLGRELRTGCGGLPGAVLSAVGAAILSGRHGAARERRQPAAVPLRRHSEAGAGRHHHRLFPVRAVQGDRRSEQGRLAPAAGGRRTATVHRCRHWRDHASAPGGWVCASARHPHNTPCRARRGRRGCGDAAAVVASLADSVGQRPARGGISTFRRPKPPPAPPGSGGLLTPPKAANSEPMLVRADEMHYDQTNDRVAAVGGVQIYYNGSSLEADRVIYDQTTKRLHAEGNVRLTEADGKITYGEILDLSDDFRDGFVDSLRLDLPAQTRFAATRPTAERRHHRAAERHLHRLRALRRRPEEAAEVAGEGHPHHPRPG
jgi:hypothetical protein